MRPFGVPRRFLATAATFVACTMLSGANRLSAQGGGGISGVHRSFGVGVSATSFSRPIVRYPSGATGVPVDQSVGTIGLRLSWFALARPHGGIELTAEWVRASFDAFDLYDPMSSQPELIAHYGGPTVDMLFFDVRGHWAPFVAVPWSLYGLVGVGSDAKEYAVSDAAFPQWNGTHADGQFLYSYGVGTGPGRARPQPA